ncbi:MAG TPA: DUF3108 domain-containing protein [Candidatus Omnitrophota bacterium]|jgi:hypothetical protein|nr:DUF3108 domain-containing protein [Candidatus Omnitrophota bacterium]HSA32083.1 DUF3108 domain-containing protein [Candidatus Omnitrophota bacterium]
MKFDSAFKIFVCGFFMGCAFIPVCSVSAEAVYAPGETIRYQIKKMGIKAGDAVLEYKGVVEDGGRELVLLVFTADGFNFYDEEKIYADPETLLPVRVERDLNIFGKKEKIVEYYEQDAARVRVIKFKKGKDAEEQVLAKEGPIDNLYCFIYRYRSQGRFLKGETMTLELPTKSVEIKVVEKTSVKVGPGDRAAFFMESVPSEYRVWFGDDPGRTPLRIDGAVGFAKTQMIFVSSQPGEQAAP